MGEVRVLEFSSAVEEVNRDGQRRIYVLVGTEYVLVQRFLATLAARLGQVHDSDPDVLRVEFEQEGLHRALLACQSVSLFGMSSVVVLEDCLALAPGSKSKHDVSDLVAYADEPSDINVLVIVVPAEKLDERKSVVKSLKKHVIINCNPPKGDEAVRVLSREAQRRHISVTPPALSELWRRCQSVSACEVELVKLWTYTDGQQVDVADVMALVALPPEDNVFQWVEAVVRGDASRAFSSLNDLFLAGQEVFSLFALMARQIRLLWFVKHLSAKGYSQQQIAAETRNHPYSVKRAAEQVRMFSLNQLETLLTLIADAEFFVKSGRRDPKQALDWIVMECLASGPAAFRAR